MKSFFNVIIYSDFEITEDNISQALNNGIHCSEDSHLKIMVNKDDKTIIEHLQRECNAKADIIGELLEKNSTELCDMEKFYFVREPDHMIECSKTLAPSADLNVIKQKHKVFKTRKEAEDYQRILGIEDSETRKHLNKIFKELGLDKKYGYC